VFTKEVTRLIIMALIVQTPILILGFLTGLSGGLAVARSRLFLMFIGIELAIALNCRSLTHSLLEVKPHKWVILAVVSQAMLTTALTFIPPARTALGIVFPSTADLIWILIAALETVLSIELLKKYWKSRPATTEDSLNSSN
jgi:Ca2+-transporting ATPase